MLHLLQFCCEVEYFPKGSSQELICFVFLVEFIQPCHVYVFLLFLRSHNHVFKRVPKRIA